MRIVHITDRVSERGGADVHLLGVVRAQLAAGHDVRLVAGRDDETAAIDAKRILVRGLDEQRRELASSVLFALRAATQSADVVHVHNAVNPAVLEWAAERGAIATVQDHRGFCPGRGKLTLAANVCTVNMDREACAACFDDAGYHQQIHDVTERRGDALRRMRAITVLSRYMARELSAVGVDEERVQVIPPFVHDLDVNAEPAGDPCVLFAGRLVEAKGVRDALTAHAASEVALPLVFAGTGSLRDELAEGFEVLGWRPHCEMGGVYRRARALLMPSRWQEPFGIAGIEALACGVPVVAYDSGGIAEWHPAKELLVPWGDVDALGAALATAVEGPRSLGSFPAEAPMRALSDLYLSPAAAY